VLVACTTIHVSEVGGEGVRDALVPCGLVGPATLVGVVAQQADVVALCGEDARAFGVGDEVVALFTDVGVGAGAGDRVAGAEPVGDAGLEHLGAQPVDLGGDRAAAASGDA
jgi:hypothetical protein